MVSDVGPPSGGGPVRRHWKPWLLVFHQLGPITRWVRALRCAQRSSIQLPGGPRKRSLRRGERSPQGVRRIKQPIGKSVHLTSLAVPSFDFFQMRNRIYWRKQFYEYAVTKYIIITAWLQRKSEVLITYGPCQVNGVGIMTPGHQDRARCGSGGGGW